MNIMIAQMEYIEALVSFKLMAQLQMLSPNVSKDQVYETHAAFVRAKDAYKHAILTLNTPPSETKPVVETTQPTQEPHA